MDVDEDRETVRLILEEMGVSARALKPSPTHKTPDLQVSVNDQRILIEVESKTEDQQVRDLVNGSKGGTLLYRGARNEDRIKAAWRQIRDYPHRSSSDASLVWFLACKGGSTILVAPSAKRLIYGIELTEVTTNSGDVLNMPCYFFQDSFFYREKELDFIVVHGFHSPELCINPYSPRYKKLRAGDFVAKLSKHMTIIDPLDEESSGRAFVADCDVDRRQSRNVAEYIRAKYALRLLRIEKFVLVNYPAD